MLATRWLWVPARARYARLAGTTAELDALHRQRHALTDAGAPRGERALAPDLVQLMRRRHRDARPRHAERMAERDRAAIRIDVFGIVRKPELAHHGETLRGECLVEFDHVEIADAQAQPLHQLARGGHRA